MKLILLSWPLFLLPLLLSSSTYSSETTETASAATTVYDTDGKILRRGQRYHILPVLRGRGGGGLTLAQRNTTICPPFVAQSPSELSAGLPVTFSPADPKSKVVALSADFNVAFAAATICVQSTAWRLADADLEKGRRFVSIGGAMGNPGLSTVSSWFRIERFIIGDNDDDDGSYKLVFCPGVCKYCKVVCGDLGVVVDGDGKRWLVMGADAPFPVMFKTTQS